MTPLVIIAIVAAIPVVLAIVLRVNTVFIFLSLTVGDLLVRYLGDNAKTIAGAFVKGGHTDSVVPIILLWLPIALTVLLLRRSLPSSKLILHIVPLAATGIATAVITLNLLTTSFQSSVYANPTGHIVQLHQDLVLAGTGVLILLLMWVSFKPDHEGHHRRHH